MATLWAEARLGELLRPLADPTLSREGKRQLPEGIDYKTSFIAQEVVEVTDVEKSETTARGFPHMAKMLSFKICPRRGRF